MKKKYKLFITIEETINAEDDEMAQDLGLEAIEIMELDDRDVEIKVENGEVKINVYKEEEL